MFVTESSTQALNTLADVLGDYLTKLCKLLRTTSDEQAESGCLGFQDALDQSLYQTGIGGKAELHKYWQTSVKEYTRRLQRETEECAEKYTKATVSVCVLKTDCIIIQLFLFFGRHLRTHLEQKKGGTFALLIAVLYP